MNTANKITMIRVVLVPIFMVLFMIDNVMCHYAALGVFVLASITDAIDGHVARKYNQVTTFRQIRRSACGQGTYNGGIFGIDVL